MRFSTLVLLTVFVPVLAWGQAGALADLEGMVVDEAGAGIPGATLVVTNKETGVERRGETNAIGRYRIAALPASEYDLRVSKTGFATVERRGLVLQVGQVATVEITLPVATQVQQITVTEAAPMIETARHTVGAVVNRAEIDNLPINGRNFLDYARTVAGVTAQQSSGQGSGLSFNGQRGRSNNITVDGADNNGQLNGNTRLTMSQEAVREFQVVSNLFAPEFGNAGGGLVNVVSRSGSNQYQGNVFFFIRDESLDGRNAFATGADKPPFNRKNTGATLGGPWRRNKTFFFAAIEYMDRNESDITTISDSAVRTINSVLASRPIPNAGVKSITNGAFPVDRIDTLASLRIDHSFGPKDNVMFRYIFGQTRESNGGGVGIGQLVDVSGGGGQKGRDQSFLGSWTHVFTPTLLGETRVQFAPRRLTQYANDPIGPRVTISGVATWGRSANFPVLLDEGRWQFTQSFSKQLGRHYFKFGTAIQDIRAHTSFPSNFGGTFSFASLNDFVAGRVNQFSQGFGNPDIRLPDTLLGFYFQDTYRPTEKLSLTYGVRYDYDMQPQGIPRDRNNPIEAGLQDGIHRDANNIAPRVGITYNPDGKGRLLIRTGYGLFYDKIFLLVARNALIARSTLTLASAQATEQLTRGAFPQSRLFPTGFALPRPSLNLVDSNIEIPYSQHSTFGVERAIGNNWMVGGAYVFVRGVQGLWARNVNLAPPIVLTAENAASLGVARPTPQQIGRRYYGSARRLDPNYNNIFVVASDASSTYSAGTLTVQKRFSRGLQFRANYTLSRTIDFCGDFTQAEAPADTYDMRSERGLSDQHQKHRFTLTGVYELPWKNRIYGNWMLSTHWVLRSGVPSTVTVGSDVNGDGNNNDRPFVGAYTLGRNTSIGYASHVVDVRLSKVIPLREKMKLQILAEAFNVQNRVNYNSRNLTWGTDLQPRDTLYQVQGAASPRQIQMGLKFAW